MLHFDTVAGPEASRALVVLHGILGRGKNWRSLARRLVAAAPAWAAVLVDLRLHGDSRDVLGPHDLAAAARDLDAVAAALPFPVAGVAGHSFGGKVALAWARTRALSPVILLDSSPGARPDREGEGAVGAVFRALGSAPGPFPDRRGFTHAMMARGIDEPVARWLALNLVREEAGYRFGVDLEGARALLHDYYRADYWDVVAAEPAVFSLVATRSDVHTPADVERLREQLGERLRVVEAGHWLHVDAPGATLDQLVSILSVAGRARPK